MKVVLDTNVIISRVIVPQGIPAQIFQHWENDAFELLTSEPILTECRRVLSYKRIQMRHSLTESEKDEIIEEFRTFGTVVETDLTIEAVENDPDDDKFLECAVAGNADYIVSGDEH